MIKNQINVFMHTFEDTDTFFNGIYNKQKQYNLYATHAGVVEYIKEKYNVKSILLSSFITQKEIDIVNNESFELSDKIICKLDNQYSNKISKIFKIEDINFFSSLYSYIFPFVLTSLKVFKKELLKLDNGNENIVFEYKDIFLNEFLLKAYLGNTLDKNSINIKWYKANDIKNKKNFKNKIFFILNNLDKVYNKFLEFYFDWLSYLSTGKTTILYMDELYDLKFIKKSKDFKFIPYGYQSLKHKFSLFKTKNIHKVDLNNILNISMDNIEHLLSKFLINNFLENSHIFMVGLRNLDSLIKKNSINLAIWGNPPTKGFRSLFYEYCRVKNIKVLGMQHGACYVDQNIKRLYYADFIRCDYYISYGFTQKDLEDNFKDKNFENIKVFPIGTTKLLPESSHRNKKIDVLFPVTNSASMFDGGLSRVKPDILHNDQVKILKLLEYESKSKITSVIKPMKQTNLWQTSVLLQLNKLRYARVEYNKSFTELLLELSPKCIIIEYISTPLYEALDLDVDIFLFIREVDNLTNKARMMLEKRVFIIETFEEFNIVFDKWQYNKLDAKRDSSYSKYYKNTKNTKNNIIKLLKNIL